MYVDPGGPPQPESQAIPGERFSDAVAPHSDPAR